MPVAIEDLTFDTPQISDLVFEDTPSIDDLHFDNETTNVSQSIPQELTDSQEIDRLTERYNVAKYLTVDPVKLQRLDDEFKRKIAPLMDSRPRTPSALATGARVNMDEIMGQYTQEMPIVVPQDVTTDEPIISEDAALKALKFLRRGSPINNEYTRGAERSVAKMASGLTTSQGVMATAIAPFAPQLIASYFAVEGAKSFGEIAGQTSVDWDSLTPQEQGERAGDLLLSGAIPASLLIHGAMAAREGMAKINTPPVIPKDLPEQIKSIAPKTAETLKVNLAAAKPSAEQPPAPAATDLTGQPTPTVAEAETKGVEQNATPEVAKPSEVPPIISMGGATPSEFEKAADNPTAMKYRRIDEERVQRGLEPLTKPEGTTDDATMSYAMQKVDQDPALPERLISELNEKSRVIEDWENHVLLLSKIDLRRELQKANDAINQFADDGMPEMAETQKIRRAELSDKLQALEEASRVSGSARGRALRALRVMANEDYSLAAMESDMRASHGGRKLTDQEYKDLTEMSKQLQDALKERDEAMATANERISRSEVDRMLDEARTHASKAPSFSPGILARAEELVNRFKESDAVKAARARLQGRLLSPSPQDILDVALITATHIAEGAVKGAKLTAELISKFGEGIRPFMDQIYDKAEKFHDDYLKSTADAPRIKRALRAKATIDEQVADATNEIRDRFENDKKSIHPYVDKIFRAMVEQDIARGLKPDRESLFDRIHEILKLIDPEITRQEAIDAISGRGIFTLPASDAVSVEVRDLKTQARLIGHQLDVEAGKPLPRTGPQRDKMSDAARREEQKLNELKRKYGVVATDPTKQLESVLNSRKTYYRHRLADLKAEIAAKERIVKGKSPSPTDPELDALKKEYEQVKAEHQSIFGDRKLTDEQRAKLAEAAAQKNLEQWQTKLVEAKKGIFNGKKASAKVSNAKIEAIRARTEAIKDEVASLKDVNANYQAALEAKRLTAQIAEYEQKIKDGKILPEAKPAKPGSPANEALRQRLQLVRDVLTDLRDKSPEYQQKRAEAALKLVEASNEELARKINEGEIEAAKKGPSTVTSPELEAARAEHVELQKIMQELRNAAKPRKTPEQIALQAAKTNATNRIAELQEKTAKGDFSTKPRRTVVPDRELIEKQLRLEDAKQTFEKAKEKARLENRTWQERWRDNVLKWRRQSLLSGVASLFKLTAAAIERVGFTAAEEGIGSVLSHLPGIKEVAERAPTEGKGSLSIEVKSLHESLTKGMKDAWDTLRKGKSELDALYGKRIRPEDEMWQEFFGRLHGFLKAPVKRNAFERSLMKRMEFAARQGEDITDPLIQTRLSMEAYADANKSIFLQDNVASKSLNIVTRYLEGQGMKVAPAVIRWFLPIVKVPTNIVAEAFTYATGSVVGSGKVALALKRGVDTLKPEQADLIMRQLKKGSLGGGVLVLGYIYADNIGGYYQGTKQKPDAPKYGGLKVFGTDIPRFLVHNPLLEMLQLGATVRHVAESKLHKKDTEPQGVGIGVMAGVLGLTEEVPFVRSIVELSKAFDTRERGRFFGQNIKEALVPRLLQDVAEHMDQDSEGQTVKRDPKSIGEYIETGVPGLRQTVPVKKKAKP